MKSSVAQAWMRMIPCYFEPFDWTCTISTVLVRIGRLGSWFITWGVCVAATVSENSWLIIWSTTPPLAEQVRKSSGLILPICSSSMDEVDGMPRYSSSSVSGWNHSMNHWRIANNSPLFRRSIYTFENQFRLHFLRTFSGNSALFLVKISPSIYIFLGISSKFLPNVNHFGPEIGQKSV